MKNKYELKIKKYKNNPVIFPDYKNSYENSCTFNPTAVVKNNKIFLIYRADTPEHIYFISSLCLAVSDDGFKFKKYKNNPVIKGEGDLEKYGCQDPRITEINGIYYLTYTGYKGFDEHTKRYYINLCLATSKDMINWKKHGIIIKNTKAGQIYPEKVNGKYLMFYGEGEIKTAWSDNLIKWNTDKDIFLKPRKNYFDSELVETACSPLFVRDKAVIFYNSKDKYQRYMPSFIIVKREDPTKIIYRHDKPVLLPDKYYEQYGTTNNVVFLEGVVEFKDKILFYYGAGDKVICVAYISKKEFIKTFSE